MIAFNQAPSEVEAWQVNRAMSRYEMALKKIEG